MTNDELAADVAACDAAGCPRDLTAQVVQAASKHKAGTVRELAMEMHKIFGAYNIERGYHRATLEHRIAALGKPEAPAPAATPAPGVVDFGPGMGAMYTGREIDAPTARARHFKAMQEAYEKAGGRP
jgi:hypothetical protein